MKKLSALVFIVAFGMCVVFDWTISAPPLKWPGATKLLGDIDGEYERATVYALVALVAVMYCYLAWTVSKIFDAGVLLSRIEGTDIASWREVRPLVAKAMTQPDQASRYEDLLELPVTRATRLAEELKSANSAGVAMDALRRLEPRDLLGIDELIMGVERHIDHVFLRLRSQAQDLDWSGNFAAALGLTGTVLGLIAGTQETEGGMVGSALMTGLQAALIKTFIGYFTKVLCLLATHQIDAAQQSARDLARETLYDALHQRGA
jgi:biopolymer transport protein ExbB/TolQ